MSAAAAMSMSASPSVRARKLVSKKSFSTYDNDKKYVELASTIAEQDVMTDAEAFDVVSSSSTGMISGDFSVIKPRAPPRRLETEITTSSVSIDKASTPASNKPVKETESPKKSGKNPVADLDILARLTQAATKLEQHKKDSNKPKKPKNGPPHLSTGNTTNSKSKSVQKSVNSQEMQAIVDENNELKSKIKMMSKTRVSLQSRISELDAQNKNLTGQLTDLKEVKDAASALSSKVSAATAREATLVNDLKGANKKIEQLLTEKGEQSEKLQNQASAISELQNRVEELEDELSVSKSRNEEYLGKMSSLQAEMESIKCDSNIQHETKTSQHEAELQTLRDELAKCKFKLEEATAGHDSRPTKTEPASLSRQPSVEQASASANTGSISLKAQEILKESQEKEKSLRSVITQLTLDSEKLEEQLSSSRAEVSKLEQELKEREVRLKESLETNKSKSVEAEQGMEVASLRLKVVELESELQRQKMTSQHSNPEQSNDEQMNGGASVSGIGRKFSHGRISDASSATFAVNTAEDILDFSHAEASDGSIWNAKIAGEPGSTSEHPHTTDMIIKLQVIGQQQYDKLTATNAALEVSKVQGLLRMAEVARLGSLLQAAGRMAAQRESVIRLVSLCAQDQTSQSRTINDPMSPPTRSLTSPNKPQTHQEPLLPAATPGTKSRPSSVHGTSPSAGRISSRTGTPQGHTSSNSSLSRVHVPRSTLRDYMYALERRTKEEEKIIQTIEASYQDQVTRLQRKLENLLMTKVNGNGSTHFRK